MNANSFLQDARFGFRILLKSPGFAVACVLTLALGIGCATTMFSLFEGPILNRPPVQDLNRIANVWATNQQTGQERGLVSVPNFLDLRSRASAFENLSALAESDAVLTGMGAPRRVSTLAVSANFFQMLGATRKLGRGFLASEERPGASCVAVISETMWRTNFGGSPDVLGRSMLLNHIPYRIVGVMPKSFWFQDHGTEVWIPLTLSPSANRASGKLIVVGSIKKGVTAEQANAEVRVLAHALDVQFPSANEGMGMRVVTYQSQTSKKTGLGLAFGLGPSLLVLLIGCANITNLLLARGFARQTEFATRAALGGTRTRLVRQLLSEYLLIAFGGATAGIVTAYGGVAVMRHALQSVQPSLAASLSMNANALAFGTGVGVLVPLLFGLIPALRVSNAALSDALRQTSAVTGAQVSLKRLPLVVFEIMIAMMLLIVTASIVRTMAFIERAAPPRIDAQKVVSFTITTTPSGAALHRLAAHLETIAGVSAVGITSGFPTSDSRSYVRSLRVRRDGVSADASAVELTVDRGFFQVLGLSPIKGNFGMDGAVVSESFAQRYSGNAVALQIRSGGSLWLPVAAVVPDWLTDARSGRSVPTVYLPFSRRDTASQIAVRTEDARTVIPELERAVRSWNPDEPMDDCRTVAQLVKEEFAGSNLVVQLTGSFTLLALVLACVGVYGVMNYSVTRRTQEMGIRIALGAAPRQILGLVLKEAVLLLAVGVSTGWLFGIAAGRLLAHELIVAPSDPTIAAACSLVIVITGLAAAYIPARRAASVNPMVVLRFE